MSLLVVPLGPLVAALLLVLASLLPASRAAASRLAAWMIASGLLASLGALAMHRTGTAQLVTRWLIGGTARFTVGLELGALERAAALLVLLVALPTVVYAHGYTGERRVAHFAWLGTFVGTMLAFVMASSWVVLVAAWEGIGVTSFALIAMGSGERARRAAVRAFVVTRAADAGLLVAWLLAARAVRTTEVDALVEAAPSLPQEISTLIALLVLVAVAGKCAQLPFSSWLPSAMVAPTPVSALLHSATLVAAGVFLVIRLFPLFQASPAALTCLAALGGLSAVVAAFVATASADLKQVLAWSTVSQVGEMILALGLGAPLAAAHHLGAHASFKAALFLGAGVFERATGTRELASLGGTSTRMPVATGAFVMCALALSAVFPLGGFWSEERIAASAARAGSGWLAVVLAAAFLAGAYAGRMVSCLFARSAESRPSPRRAPVPTSMLGGFCALALLGASGGALIEAFVLPHLPLDANAPPEPAVRAGMVMASLVGLTAGALRAWHRGPVPTFGAWPLRLARGADALVRAPAVATRFTAGTVARLEAAASDFQLAAMEHVRAGATALLTVDRAQGRLFALASESARRAADRAARFDENALNASVDRLSAAASRAAERARASQTGRMYVYAMTLFGATVAGAVLLALASG